MKIICNKEEMKSAVTKVIGAVSQKSAISAIEGILVKSYGDTIFLAGYDLEIGITTTIDATISSQGEIVVSARLFSEIVRKLPEEVVCIDRKHYRFKWKCE